MLALKSNKQPTHGMQPANHEASSADAHASVMVFEHETMFSRCPIGKVFEINSPEQSGHILHSHDYLQIWYVTRGMCEHYVEGQKYQMHVGDAFIMPPKVSHKTLILENSSIMCCEFFMKELFPEQTGTYDKLLEITQNISFAMLFQSELLSTHPKFTLSVKGQRAVEKLMRSMLTEYNNGEAFYGDYLYLQILQLLLTFAREHEQSPVHEETDKAFDKYCNMVRCAIQYIDQNYHQPLTLDGICQISMVSKTYFCYIFKLLTQKTFLEYLIDLRINKAMELLRSTDHTIIDISQSVGFQDSTHFSRTFKRLRGISPRQYRTTVK